jgi:hypothetical protein
MGGDGDRDGLSIVPLVGLGEGLEVVDPEREVA